MLLREFCFLSKWSHKENQNGLLRGKKKICDHVTIYFSPSLDNRQIQVPLRLSWKHNSVRYQKHICSRRNPQPGCRCKDFPTRRESSLALWIPLAKAKLTTFCFWLNLCLCTKTCFSVPKWSSLFHNMNSKVIVALRFSSLPPSPPT